MSREESVRFYLKEGNYQKALEELDANELEAAAHTQPNKLYGIHLLTLLILNDLNNARFLWKRLPKDLKANNEFQAIWSIGKNMWKREYPNVYKTAAEFAWSADHAPLVAALIEGFRQRTLSLIATAYATISEADTSNLLGLPLQEITPYLSSKGWKQEGGFVYPAKPETKSNRTTDQKQLQQLTNYILFLEQSM